MLGDALVDAARRRHRWRGEPEVGHCRVTLDEFGSLRDPCDSLAPLAPRQGAAGRRADLHPPPAVISLPYQCFR